MASEKPQNLQNHVRLVPPFHYFVLPVLLVNLGWTIRHLIRVGISFESVFGVLLALALFMLAGYERSFSLTVQDRVIRLETCLRMQQVLPADLRARIPEFTLDQLVSLRFASDAELPALARKVLDEKLIQRKTIKGLIQSWQPDLLRV